MLFRSDGLTREEVGTVRISACRGRRVFALLFASLTLVAVVALPASAKQSSTAVNQSITNDPSADLCVWGSSNETWIAPRTYVTTDAWIESTHYGCSSPRNLPGSYLSVAPDLYKGGWPNVVLCGAGPTVYNSGPSSYIAVAPHTFNTCGQNTIYWTFGKLQMYVYPGVWYPQPEKIAASGPVNGVCDPYCA